MLGLLFATLALAADDTTDRLDEVHQHEFCGPVPWEAFQVATYESHNTATNEVGVEGNANALTQSGGGKITVKNGKTVDDNGDIMALPVSGQQWTAMYITYMSCIVSLNTGAKPENVKGLWKSAMKNGVVKSATDATDFMRAAGTLMNPAADGWREQMKAMLTTLSTTHDVDVAALSADQQAQAAALEAELGRVDDLYTQTTELRTNYIALKSAHDNLVQVFEDTKATQSDINDEVLDRLKGLEKKVDDLGEVVIVLQENIKTEAEDSVAEAPPDPIANTAVQ
jgi:hypothetical protein